MDFRQTVMQGAEAKYRDMADGTTEKPFSHAPALHSENTYQQKRNDYQQRLFKEHREFSDAVRRIKEARRQRQAKEAEAKKIRDAKRAANKIRMKKMITAVVVVAAIAAFAIFIVYPKMIYPNMNAKNLYTPEILQTYSGSTYDKDTIITFTDCSADGQVKAVWETFADNGNWKVNLVGKIIKKNNKGNLTITWISNEVEYTESGGTWKNEISAKISNNYQILKTDAQKFGAGVNDSHYISTAADLEKLKNSDGIYILKNDIDMRGIDWAPIQGFSGTLIGNGHTIKNLTVNSSKTFETYIGFFSTLQGTVKDLNFENANITVASARENVGILCGELSGTAINIKVSGKVSAPSSDAVGGIIGKINPSGTGRSIYNLQNSATVTGNNYVGGIFGFINYPKRNGIESFTFGDHTNSGAITGSNYVGGTFGYVYVLSKLYISDCKNTGNVKGKTNIGGIVGYVNGYCPDSYIKNSSCSALIEGEAIIGCIAGTAIDTKIKSCENKGSALKATGYVTEDGNKNAYVGGFAGKGQMAIDCINNVSIDYTAGGAYVGGIIGYAKLEDYSDYDDVYMANLSNNADINGGSYVGGIFGYAYTYSDTYSVNNFKNTADISGDNYVGGIFGHIYSKHTLYISDCSNIGDVKGKTYIGGIAGYTEGYRSSSYIQNSSCAALIEGEAVIGCIAGAAINTAIKSCENKGSALKATGYVTEDGNKNAYVGGFAGKGQMAIDCTNNVSINYRAGGSYVGGIIGYINTKSYSGYDNISMANLFNKADISGGSYVGGIFGYIYTESDTYYANNFKNTADINGDSYVGGIFGYAKPGNSGLAYLTKQETGISYFSNDGFITGTGDNIGGIFGFIYVNHALYISDCENTGKIKGKTYIGGIAGYARGKSGYLKGCATSENLLLMGKYEGLDINP